MQTRGLLGGHSGLNQAGIRRKIGGAAGQLARLTRQRGTVPGDGDAMFEYDHLHSAIAALRQNRFSSLAVRPSRAPLGCNFC
jgi:hypothetical protein